MTSKGRLTGRDITTPLVYRRQGNAYLVVASKGGAPENPLWYSNVQDHPIVEVEVAADGGTTRFSAHARAISSGPERDHLFNYMTEVWPAFRDYQARTSRTIPIVVLEPID